MQKILKKTEHLCISKDFDFIDYTQKPTTLLPLMIFTQLNPTTYLTTETWSLQWQNLILSSMLSHQNSIILPISTQTSQILTISLMKKPKFQISKMTKTCPSQNQFNSIRKVLHLNASKAMANQKKVEEKIERQKNPFKLDKSYLIPQLMLIYWDLSRFYKLRGGISERNEFCGDCEAKWRVFTANQS